MWQVVGMKSKKVYYKGETYKQCLDAITRLKVSEKLNVVVAE